MSKVQKTTVYLDSADYVRLKSLARQSGKKPASLVREAVAEFAKRHGRKKRARSIGVGRSGRRDLAERAEELLEGFGRPQ